MSALSIQPTYPIFTETDGLPLENGYIWIGTVNLDPQVNPISVYWDAALTQPAGQPIRTLNGYPSKSGTPARLYVNSDYSIRVMNSKGSLVYSAPAATERYGNVIDAEGVTYNPPFTGAVQTNVESKLAQTVSVKDFGAIGDGVTDDTAEIQAALDAKDSVQSPSGTYELSSVVVLNQNNKISGDGERVSIFHNIGITQAFKTPDSTPGGQKSYSQGMSDFSISGTNSSTPFAQALLVQQTGNTYWEKGIIEKHNTLLDLEGAVGTVIRDVTLSTGTNGFRTNGINTLDATNLTDFHAGSIILTTNAISINGVTKALHFTETDLESNTNLYVEVGGAQKTNNLVFRNCWFENNTNMDLGTALSPVIDTCYFSGEVNFTGGTAPIFNNIHVTGSTNWPQFYTNSEIAYTSLTGQTFTNVGQHGLYMTMPKIGAVSTPVDKYAPQQTAQSALIGELSGTLFGYSQPLQNLIANPVSQTSFTPAGYWPYGGATVTTGQADMYGGTNATKLEIGSGNGTHGSSNIATTPGNWYVIQIAFNIVTANQMIGLFAQSQGGTLDKRNYYQIPDTNVRVLHMLFKADDTAVRLFISLPTSGVIVQRICMFAGQELKPMIKEGANYNAPFMMEFNNVVSYASAVPTTGTWAVGDKVYNTAPTAGGTIGWVCTTAGTPGTWKTFGAIAS